MSARSDLPGGLVTFLFTDIEGSTRLVQLLGEDYRETLHEHRSVIRAAIATASGIELFTEGDALFVVFADATAALRACAEAQRALASHAWRHPEIAPRVRMGLHTGPAEPHGGEYASAEVHRAARIAAAAHGGQVLCSAATARQATDLRTGTPALRLLDLGPHRLRGFDGRERLYQLVGPGLATRFPRPRTAGAQAHNLPVMHGSFIGRQRESAELSRLLRDRPLVTVVGPGGIGKTRLAVEVATGLVDDFPDGVWMVDLAATLPAAGGGQPPIADLAGAVGPGLSVELAVAATLGLRPEPGRPLLETIAEYITDHRILLVIDTCEARPAPARRLIGRLMAASRSVRIVATSREPLGVPGELVWALGPLCLDQPADRRGGLSDAAALLADRAAALAGRAGADPGGGPAGLADRADLQQIVVALDGIPLAVELAAARLRVLSPGQLASRLEDVVGTLDAPGPGRPDPQLRHQSISSTITWSYRSLGGSAARLLRALSVFAGPVELSAIEWMNEGDPLGPLATLVDKSLVRVESSPAGAVYRILNPIRCYARRRLAKAGEATAARDRHVDWCLGTAIDALARGDHRTGATTLEVLDPLTAEARAALGWTVQGGSPRRGLAMVGALDPWWRERGLAREGRMWLFRLYERVGATGERVPEAELAQAFHLHAVLAGAEGEHSEQAGFVARAEESARAAGSPALIIRALAGRGPALLGLGRLAEAEQACRETLAVAETAGVPGEALPAAYALAELLWRRGDLGQAADLLAAARPVEAARPVDRARRGVDLLLGLVALARRDLVAAHEHLAVALRSRLRSGFKARVCEALSAMAVRCALGGDASTAAKLFGAAQAARARLGCGPGTYGSFWAEYHSTVRAVLGDRVFDAAYAEGGALSLADAAALALAVEHPDLALGSLGRSCASSL